MCEDFGSNSCNSREAIFAKIPLLCAAIEEKNCQVKNSLKYVYINQFDVRL